VDQRDPDAVDLPTPEEIEQFEADYRRAGEGRPGGLVGADTLAQYAAQRSKGERLRTIRGKRDIRPELLLSPQGYLVWPAYGGETGREVAVFSFVKDDCWQVVGTVAHIGASELLEVYSIQIRPKTIPPTGMSGRFLSSIKPHEIISEVKLALRQLRESLESWETYWHEKGIRAPAGLVRLQSEISTLGETVQTSEPRRRGRRPYSDQNYARLAIAHVKACEMSRGASGIGVWDLTAKVYEDIFGEPCPFRDVRDAGRRAREKSFLTPARNGKAGRSLGWRFEKEQEWQPLLAYLDDQIDRKHSSRKGQ
jgi:hypothetical protein